MADFYDFNSTFFLSVGTLIITGSGVCLGYALKSKCSSVKLCGCIEIVRDIEAEIEETRIVGVPPVPNELITPVISRRQSYCNEPIIPFTPVTSRRESLIDQSVIDFTASMTNN